MHLTSLLSVLILASEVAAAPAADHAQAGSHQSIKNLKDKIKNVVFIIMENRSVDNLLGGQKIRGLDNPINSRGGFCNPLNLTDPSEGVACSKANDYDSILDDPDHAVYGNNIEFYSTFRPDNKLVSSGALKPTMNGFVHEQRRLYSAKANSSVLATQVMNYYTEEQVPVITELTQQFVTFNHFHSDIPGPTNPNRASFHSGTSAGHGTNDNGFDISALTQRSIFQQLTETNHTWANYETTAGGADALFFSWTVSSGASTSNVKPLDTFYDDAAAGTLPEFTFINPSCCGVGTTSMHPTGLISDGEILLKSVYDAVRAGPQWDNTLFIISFDETGGFHDHVAPPLAVRPDNLTYTASTPDGGSYTFNFDRLGGRLPTWLVSPWVDKAFVEQQGTNTDGQKVSYSASSVLRTLGYLWDFEPFTPRVAHAASFDHLITNVKREDTPASLPKPTPFRK